MLGLYSEKWTLAAFDVQLIPTISVFIYKNFLSAYLLLCLCTYVLFVTCICTFYQNKNFIFKEYYMKQHCISRSFLYI